MPRAYDIEVRARVISAVKSGEAAFHVARENNVSYGTVLRWLRNFGEAAWNTRKSDQNLYTTLFASMSERLENVIRSDGFAARY